LIFAPKFAIIKLIEKGGATSKTSTLSNRRHPHWFVPDAGKAATPGKLSELINRLAAGGS
jgi:hypothetical protein